MEPVHRSPDRDAYDVAPSDIDVEVLEWTQKILVARDRDGHQWTARRPPGSSDVVIDSNGAIVALWALRLWAAGSPPPHDFHRDWAALWNTETSRRALAGGPLTLRTLVILAERTAPPDPTGVEPPTHIRLPFSLVTSAGSLCRSGYADRRRWNGANSRFKHVFYAITDAGMDLYRSICSEAQGAGPTDFPRPRLPGKGGPWYPDTAAPAGGVIERRFAHIPGVEYPPEP